MTIPCPSPTAILGDVAAPGSLPDDRDPIHYLALLEQGTCPGSAAPLGASGIRPAFGFWSRSVLHGAVKDALRLGAIGYTKPLCRIERRPPKLDLDVSYLPRANVATTAAASYMSLLGGGAS